MNYRKPVDELQTEHGIEDRNSLIERYKMIRKKFKLTDRKIKTLLIDYTFTEIMEGYVDRGGIFVPKELIMPRTKKYLTNGDYYLKMQ